jgi:hypothetical protein
MYEEGSYKREKVGIDEEGRQVEWNENVRGK